MARAEYLKKHIKVSMHSNLRLYEKIITYFRRLNSYVLIFQMQETQRDVSMDREPLADSVRTCKFPRCVALTLPSAMRMWFL